MFDRTYVVRPPARPSSTYVRVTEERAPVEESARLLREMEAAAAARILDSIKLVGTHFECVVHTMLDGPSGDLVIAAVFSLGGCKMRVEVRDANWKPRAELVEKLIAAIAERIAHEIVRPCLITMAK